VRSATGLIPSAARRLALALGLLCATAMTAAASSAYASGANFIATGHDMDFHCSVAGAEEIEQECKYFKIVVEKVRNGSTLPILALDQGRELPTALENIGFTKAGEVVTVNPANAKELEETAFVNGSGEPLYSIIITASDETCGGCDDNEEGEGNINARAADFKTFFNAGGGILALAGANRFETYYNFVPLKVGATAVSPPFEVTPEGESLGITNEEANCCVTHNSFNYPPPEPFVTLEKDNAGKAETIAAFNVKITEKGFSTITTTLSGGGKSGEKITVEGGTAVTDAATLTGEHVASATGTVEYKVYSDNECTKLVANAGSVEVSGPSAPSSNPETLAPGTYYWQASYSGDELNKPATSGCGEEVETVEGASCTRVYGRGHWGEGGNLGNNLSTNLAEGEHLATTTPNGEFHVYLDKHRLTSASCVAIEGGFEFSGTGPAVVNHAHGYTVSFAFAKSGSDTFYTLIVEKEGVVVYALIHQKLKHGNHEHIV
jgi:hypothetical protein